MRSCSLLACCRRRGPTVASDSLLHVDAAHAAGYAGQGTTIAILDTGIDDRNAELNRRVVAVVTDDPSRRVVRISFTGFATG